MNLMQNSKHVEIRHFSNQVLTDANQKAKLENLSQDKFRGTIRSLDPGGSAALYLAEPWFTLTWPILGVLWAGIWTYAQIITWSED